MTWCVRSVCGGGVEGVGRVCTFKPKQQCVHFRGVLSPAK